MSDELDIVGRLVSCDRKCVLQFRKENPETIGETDSQFDYSNYCEWLEKKFNTHRAVKCIEAALKEIHNQEVSIQLVGDICHGDSPETRMFSAMLNLGKIKSILQGEQI